MVEFRTDLGPRRTLESRPGMQLGSRPEDAATGRLLRSLKERSAVMCNQGCFGPAVVFLAR